MSKLIGELLLASVLGLIGCVAYLMGQDAEYSPAFLAQQRPNRFQVPPARAADAAPPTASADAEHFLEHEGRRRRYVVHVPRGSDGARPLPVVLAFHGGLGRPEGLRTQTRLNDAADRHGFLAVYPEGTGVARLLTFNAGSCCGWAARQRVDDVGFVRRLLDEGLPGRYRIDRRRVYATGLSNGAMLCYRLACELPDRVAAIGPVAGGMMVDGPRPARPVPVYHVHGRKDPNVPYAGGVGRNAVQRVAHRPVEDVLAWWVKANGCRPEPAAVERQADRVLTRWEPPPGAAGAPVVLCAVTEGGHNWPGGVDTTAHLGTGPHARSVDATELLWRFFEQHQLPEPPGP
jgi:polyhydroxybutyrate depolymerase